MNQPSILFSLFSHFVLASFLAIGGASSSLPMLYAYLVDDNGWIDPGRFSALYAIAQVAPGPNVLFVALFGWQVAGVPGAAATVLGMCGPSSLLSLGFEIFAGRKGPKRWPVVARQALAPLSIGLLLSTGWILSRHADTCWQATATTVLTVIVAVFLPVHPLWLIGLGAVLGGFGFLR